MNLRDMQYIVAVADTLNFRKASELCFVSQPTLSAQIKKLESELQLKIFERNNKKVMVTEPGAAVIHSARLILKEKENIKSIATLASDPFAGSFRLGAFPTLAPYLFPKIVPDIVKIMPKIRLVLVEEKTDRLVEQLENGGVDAALLALPIENSYFEVDALFKDKFCLAVPANHPLCKYKAIKPEDFQDYNLLLLEEGHCLRDQSLELCHRHDIREDHDLRATSLETLRQMIKASTGISLIPEIAIDCHDASIVYIPFKKLAPFRHIGLVYRKTTGRKSVISELERIIKQKTNKMAGN